MMMRVDRRVHGAGRAVSVILPAGLLVAVFTAAMLTASGARFGALTLLGLLYGSTGRSHIRLPDRFLDARQGVLADCVGDPSRKRGD